MVLNLYVFRPNKSRSAGLLVEHTAITLHDNGLSAGCWTMTYIRGITSWWLRYIPKPKE